MDLNEHISEHFIWFDYLHSDTAANMGVDLTQPTEDILANIQQVNAKEEEAREILNAPISNSCCWRPMIVNRALKSSDSSAHVSALAVDMLVHGMDVSAVFDTLAAHPTFMEGVDQLIIERACVHMGLPCKASNFEPRRELRRETISEDGSRHYPLERIWESPS
jgi:Peptidase M15